MLLIYGIPYNFFCNQNNEIRFLPFIAEIKAHWSEPCGFTQKVKTISRKHITYNQKEIVFFFSSNEKMLAFLFMRIHKPYQVSDAYFHFDAVKVMSTNVHLERFQDRNQSPVQSLHPFTTM